MNIIVRKHSERNHFKPGYNIALGKVVHTKSDYLQAMKSKGLEPYDKNHTPSTPRPYRPSEKCHQLVNAIKRRTDERGNFYPTNTIMREIKDFLPRSEHAFDKKRP